MRAREMNLFALAIGRNALPDGRATAPVVDRSIFFISSVFVCCARRRASSNKASSSTDSSLDRESLVSRSASSIPSLNAFLLCPSALASCGSLLPPNNRKIAATTRIMIVGLAISNSRTFITILLTPSDLASSSARAQLCAAVRFIEKILAPGFVGAAEVAHDLAIHVQRKRARPAQQMHPRLFRCAIALAMIAALAAGHQIVPGRLSAARTWRDVVQGQLRRRELLAAILARGMIAQQDVLA